MSTYYYLKKRAMVYQIINENIEHKQIKRFNLTTILFSIAEIVRNVNLVKEKYKIAN